MAERVCIAFDTGGAIIGVFEDRDAAMRSFGVTDWHHIAGQARWEVEERDQWGRPGRRIVEYPIGVAYPFQTRPA